MKHSTYCILALITALLVGCADHTDNEIAVSTNGSGNIQLRPPAMLINSRMITQESLFAEVSISYSGITDTVTAERAVGTGDWSVQLQVPTQTEFSITVTWYDLVDPQRLDLVTTTRSFGPIDFPGEMLITRNFNDFDSDNFDADSDSIVNLTERLNGSSPFDSASPSDDDPSPSSYRFVNSANGATNQISDFEDTAPVSVVQTVPVLNSTAPSSVDTPITLFFNDKLLLESLPPNFTVLENGQPVFGTVTISESPSGFAILTFNPDQPYQDGVTVTLRITGGENGIQDDAGNRLTGNVGDDFEISITTIEQSTGNFSNNLSFESFDQGVLFSGDGAVLTGTLGCLAATAGTSFAAISTDSAIVSNGSAVNDTSSTVQIGPINVGSGTNTISFDYNFVSGEFPEFVGSEFDDSSVISISGPSGTFTDVLTTVNTVGAQGFSECAGIPGIDAGEDNFSGQTGWVSRTLDISNIGSPITITFTVTDVSDTALTSILAIDNIRF